LDLAVAPPVGVRPRHPQRAGQLALEGGPVDRVGGAAVPVDVAAVQRRPPAIGALHPVGDHQVGVDQRVALARGAVVEPDRQQAVAANMLRPAVAPSGAELPVQVRRRLGQAHVVGVQHRPPGRRFPKAVEHRDALARPQDKVEPGDGVVAVGAAQRLPGLRVAALDQPPEFLLGGLAFEAEAGSSPAVPAAW
jgi:hypothetical protein